MDISVRIAGEAGQGVDTVGGLLGDALAETGLHVFCTQSYMSRVRGGLNWVDVRAGDAELFSGKRKADLLVALTTDAADALGPQVAAQGIILCDGVAGSSGLYLDFTGTAKEVGSALMANSVAAGAVFGILGYSVAPLLSCLKARFEGKGGEVAAQNVDCAKRGAELAAPHAGALTAPVPGDAPKDLQSGSEAVGLAAATAGVKFVSSYPMTPSTAVLTYLAGVADEYGIVVEQAEDEIAAINMVCGATYAGVPAMTTTSGGGFALMCEGLSLAGMLELPVVIMLSQRPGPATGLPTRTGQEDLAFVLSAGHGEFCRAVFAPGTARQAYALTRRAFETAHGFQTPAIIMIDQFLADQRKNGPVLDRTSRPIDRHVQEDPSSDYVRYAAAPDGVSPRALPGSAAFVICDSDEHTEDGHVTEDLGARARLQDKRLAKAKPMTLEAMPPEFYGPEKADCLLIAWGSTYGPCREAVDILNAAGSPTAMVHFSQVWPLDVAAVRAAIAAAGSKPRLVSVEGNATGQCASVLRQLGALDGCELILKYDGMPFTGEEIAERVAK